jgi:hypothetical protein
MNGQDEAQCDASCPSVYDVLSVAPVISSVGSTSLSVTSAFPSVGSDLHSVASALLSVTLTFPSVGSDLHSVALASIRCFGFSFRRFGSSSVAPVFLSVAFVRTEIKLSFCFW